MSDAPLPKYQIDQVEQERIDNDFSYHPPTTGQADRYIHIRLTAHDFAEILHELCPPSRERSIAMTKLDEVVMWANASIARNENE